jgi:hypothetical protein
MLGVVTLALVRPLHLLGQSPQQPAREWVTGMGADAGRCDHTLLVDVERRVNG